MVNKKKLVFGLFVQPGKLHLALEGGGFVQILCRRSVQIDAQTKLQNSVRDPGLNYIFMLAPRVGWIKFFDLVA